MNKSKKIIFMVVGVLVVLLLLLFVYKQFIYKDNNNSSKGGSDTTEKETGDIKYEIKIDTEKEEEYLYVNGKKADAVVGSHKIPDNKEVESIHVKEFKDVLLVEIFKPGPDNSFVVIDRNAKEIKLDNKKGTYNGTYSGINLELLYLSYVTTDNSIIVSFSREDKETSDWYCKVTNKDEIVAYDVEYKYQDGKFDNGNVTTEVKLSQKFAGQSCIK